MVDDECSDDGRACNGEEICHHSSNNRSNSCTHTNPLSCPPDDEICTSDGCRDRGVNEYTCDIHTYSARRGTCAQDDCFCSERVCTANGYLWSGYPSPEGCGSEQVCCCGLSSDCVWWGGECTDAEIVCGEVERDNGECWVQECCEGRIDADCWNCLGVCESECGDKNEYVEHCIYYTDIDDYYCECTPIAPECPEKCGGSENMGWDECEEGELCCVPSSSTSTSSSTLTTLGCEYCGRVDIIEYPVTVSAWRDFEINYTYRGSGAETEYPFDVRLLWIDGDPAGMSVASPQSDYCVIDDTSDCDEVKGLFKTRCPLGVTGPHDFNITCMAVNSPTSEYCGGGFPEESSDNVSINCIFGTLDSYDLIYNFTTYSTIDDCEPQMWYLDGLSVWNPVNLYNCDEVPRPVEFVDYCVKESVVPDHLNKIVLYNVTCPATLMWNVECTTQSGLSAVAYENWTFKVWCPEQLLSDDLDYNCILCEQSGFHFSGFQFGCGMDIFPFDDLTLQKTDCCGNGDSEYYIEEKFTPFMQGVPDGNACCAMPSDCADDVCYPIDSMHDTNGDGDLDMCGFGNMWEDCVEGETGMCGPSEVCISGVCTTVENPVCWTAKGQGYSYCLDTSPSLCSIGGDSDSKSCSQICSDIGLECVNAFEVLDGFSCAVPEAEGEDVLALLGGCYLEYECSTSEDNLGASPVSCGSIITSGKTHCYCVDPSFDVDSDCDTCVSAHLDYNDVCDTSEIVWEGSAGQQPDCCGDEDGSEIMIGFRHATSPVNYNPCDSGSCDDDTTACVGDVTKCVFDGEIYVNADLNVNPRSGDVNSPMGGWADVNGDGVWGEFCGVVDGIGSWVDCDSNWWYCGSEFCGYYWAKEGERSSASLPGEYALAAEECCGDDLNEDYWYFNPATPTSYPAKEADPCDKPGFECVIDSSDDACCLPPASGVRDAVFNGRCYVGTDYTGARRRSSNDPLMGYADVDGDGIVGEFALSDGLWYDCDISEEYCGRDYCNYEWAYEGESLAGEDYPGEYEDEVGSDGTLMECCGDDAGEYFISGGRSCDGVTSACCSSPDDYVDGGVCVTECS
ncbi:MAG: hypothetical protein ABIH11_02120 [Candidatus Altiarchaeota archaeon]